MRTKVKNKQRQVGRPDQHIRTSDGRYSTGPKCYGCTKPAGDHYFSHYLTDSIGSDGERWADTALVLCRKCADATSQITKVSDFLEYAKKAKAEAKRRK